MSGVVEGAPGQTPVTETWQTIDGRTLVVYYDDRGTTQVTREAMTHLLESAGLRRGDDA